MMEDEGSVEMIFFPHALSLFLSFPHLHVMFTFLSLFAVAPAPMGLCGVRCFGTDIASSPNASACWGLDPCVSTFLASNFHTIACAIHV